jgi:hypothetical protein
MELNKPNKPNKPNNSTNFSDLGDDLFCLEMSQADCTRRASGVAGSTTLTKGFIHSHHLSVSIDLQSPELADLLTETTSRTHELVHDGCDRFNLHPSCEEGDGCPGGGSMGLS